MRDITINIHEFGPLREVELKLKPLTFLMGASSLGKSYANYLFYYLVKMLQAEAKLFADQCPADKENVELRVVLKKSCLVERLHEALEPFMRRFLGDPGLTCDVFFEFGDMAETLEFRYKLSRLEKIGKHVMEEPTYFLSSRFNNTKDFLTFSPFRNSLPYFAFSACLRDYIFDWSNIAPVILPPGRGALVGESYTTKERTGAAMGLYSDFLTQYDKAAYESPAANKSQKTRELVSNLIGGDLRTIEGKQYVILKNGYKLPLSAAASSIKEISPFLFNALNRNGHVSFCFDEPEAHLHPQMQVKAADLIAACFNKGNLFQITTHSDYFMSRINQLIKLGSIREADKALATSLCEQLDIPQMAMLKKENIAAYFFERNEEGGVKVEPLEVSDHGIPFATFYDTLSKDRSDDEKISSAYYKLMHKEGE